MEEAMGKTSRTENGKCATFQTGEPQQRAGDRFTPTPRRIDLINKHFKNQSLNQQSKFKIMEYKSREFMTDAKVWENAINDERLKINNEMCAVAFEIAQLENKLADVFDNLNEGVNVSERVRESYWENAENLLKTCVLEWFRQVNRPESWAVVEADGDR